MAQNGLFSREAALLTKHLKRKRDIERCTRKDRRIGKRCRGKQNKKVTAFVRPSGLGFSNSGMAAREKNRERFFLLYPTKLFFCIHNQKSVQKRERYKQISKMSKT